MPITAIHAFSVSITDWNAASTVVVANSTGGSTTDFASNLINPGDWNAAHNYTLNLTGSEIGSLFDAEHRVTVSSNAAGLTFGLDNQIAFYEPQPYFSASVSSNFLNGTWYVEPVQVIGALNSGIINRLFAGGTSGSSPFGISSANTTINSGQSGGFTRTGVMYNQFGLYTRGTGASSSALYSYWSQSEMIGLSHSFSITSTVATSNILYGETRSLSYPYIYNAVTTGAGASSDTVSSYGGVVYTTASGSYTTSAAASSISKAWSATMASVHSLAQSISGSICFPIQCGARISAGEYHIIHQFSTTTGQTTGAAGAFAGGSLFGSTQVFSQAIIQVQNPQAFRMLGQTASNSSTNWMPGHGFYTNAASTISSKLPITDIRNNTTAAKLYWNYQNFSA